MNKEFNEVVDSGKRQNFSTGSVRDTDEGKGQPHLICGEVFDKYLDYINSDRYEPLRKSSTTRAEIEHLLFKYGTVVKSREENNDLLFRCIEGLLELEGYTKGLTRLAIHYFNGSKKYSPNNFRKGQPISRYYDSAMRHLWKLIDKEEDEDHYAALLWNLVAIIQTKLDVKHGYLPKDLNDFPFTVEDIWGKK